MTKEIFYTSSPWVLAVQFIVVFAAFTLIVEIFKRLKKKSTQSVLVLFCPDYQPALAISNSVQPPPLIFVSLYPFFLSCDLATTVLRVHVLCALT